MLVVLSDLTALGSPFFIILMIRLLCTKRRNHSQHRTSKMAPLENFIANRLPVAAMIASESWKDQFSNWFGQFSVWFAQQWEQFLAWASQPHVIAAVLAWLITFWVVCIIILGLGFGPAGVVAGSIAATWQSYVYAGFTPAGGIFATLTSIAMLGLLIPVVAIVAAVVATIVTVTVWLCGVGR
ncbi:hypothetical protein F5144DRAFT_238443 [Chaetomium tenue]|uniref:Uncharacterized protein n=1 Tax=Chaetomium tenue TaxID=1854479 RepID=A0ACB7P974_9PEZI|nr:hypothetical protein F5144DRAFT_238443 [Chaetomium globosum]